MSTENLEKCQRYYIFKIRDLVNNSFHTFEEKRMESLVEYLDLCISTYEEYIMSLDQSKSKRALEGLLEGLDYQMQNHPFRKLLIFKSDFEYLHRNICLPDEQRDKELHNINRNIISLKKKIEGSDILEDYIVCLKSEDSFKEMDCLMEALISDLLNFGYSMGYLEEWFKKQQEDFNSSGQDTNIIERLRELNKEPERHTIYIKFVVNSESQLDSAVQLINNQFTVCKSEEFDYSNKWSEETFLVAYKEYQALDLSKALVMARKEFSAVQELFDMWQGTTGCIKADSRYGWLQDEDFKIINIRKIDNIKMLGYIDTNYKKKMERFLELRDKLDNEEIKTLERILYTLNTSKMYKIQNRFLNFWSALEYALYPFPRTTIIEKARVIVPEVFALFYIKNKMNIFWTRLNHYLENRKNPDKYEELVKFVAECKDGDGDYHTKKVIEVFLSQERVEKLMEKLEMHIVLQRECSELYMLINSPKKCAKAIQTYYDGIKHDLNFIYRLRNQLIHSARSIDDSLEYVSMRLYRYVNSVISTILYYEEKNSSFTILDILSSIDATYQDYTLKWKGDNKKKREKEEEEIETISLEEGYRMVRPPYLFME